MKSSQICWLIRCSLLPTHKKATSQLVINRFKGNELALMNSRLSCQTSSSVQDFSTLDHISPTILLRFLQNSKSSVFGIKSPKQEPPQMACFIIQENLSLVPGISWPSDPQITHLPVTYYTNHLLAHPFLSQVSLLTTIKCLLHARHCISFFYLPLTQREGGKNKGHISEVNVDLVFLYKRERK